MQYHLNGLVSTDYVWGALMNGGAVNLQPLNNLEVIFYPLNSLSQTMFSGIVGTKSATLEIGYYPGTSVLTINDR